MRVALREAGALRNPRPCAARDECARRLPISMFQPSISTKNSILIGSEITEGGSIIMPIDMVSVATIMSMTRNGSAMRKPISKPRRIQKS